MVSISLIAIGGGYNSVMGSVSVQIIDDEEPQVTGLPTLASVPEGGVKTFNTFKLAVRPTQNITVSMTPSDPDRLTLSPATLEFTPSNWDVAHSVELRGGVDGDLMDDEVIVNVTASGAPGFQGIMGLFTVRVTDTSTRSLAVEASDLSSLTEGIGQGTISVKLNSRPDRRGLGSGRGAGLRRQRLHAVRPRAGLPEYGDLHPGQLEHRPGVRSPRH